ncbi:histidine phosphatase family protein [Kribbella sp. NBC_00709]|uniref:histidine phosphatase family protein n=1 Tax=Kribbella sp. NBC_00709 TaxID=2975972 RepID=UPI002E287E64|nr:histidine phosphatase family protein [Kribbella sp. NBC_00709]
MARYSGRRPGLTVYLARHGQTEWNVAGRRQGRLDSPLTDLGLRQAARNADLLSTESIDAVFASPLGRAHRTASIIGSALGLTVEVLDDLAEIDHGSWSGLTSAEIDAGWPGLRAAREQDKYGFRFPRVRGMRTATYAQVVCLRRLCEPACGGRCWCRTR